MVLWLASGGGAQQAKHFEWAQHQQLLPHGQVFNGEVSTGLKPGDQAAQDGNREFRPA